jgi:hypothetical protein
MKYIVPICRTSFSFREIEVEANSTEEAGRIALDTAGNFEYSEKDADYEINGEIQPIPVFENNAYKKALIEYGPRVVHEAESYYGTDFDKNFWDDLNEQERNAYLAQAKYRLANIGVPNAY